MRARPFEWRSLAAAVACVVLLTDPARPGVEAPGEAAASVRADIAPENARLWVGSTRLLQFDRPVDTVVVGRSDVIDATVLDKSTIVLTALAPGWTEIVVLGQEAQVLSRLSAIVRVPEWPTTEAFRGTERSVLICDPECRPATPDIPAPPEE